MNGLKCILFFYICVVYWFWPWYTVQTKIEKLNFSILMRYFLNKKLNGNRTTDNCHISAIQQNIKDTQHACATHILSFTATCCTLTNALV